MTASVKIWKEYGFAWYWKLIVILPGDKKKEFFLGQDAKFCQRVLGMSCMDVIDNIGTKDVLEGEPGNEVLANFIIDQLGLTKEIINQLEPWALSAE